MEYKRWKIRPEDSEDVPLVALTGAQLLMAYVELTISHRFGPVHYIWNKNREPDQRLVDMFRLLNRSREQSRLGWLSVISAECRRRNIGGFNDGA